MLDIHKIKHGDFVRAVITYPPHLTKGKLYMYRRNEYSAVYYSRVTFMDDGGNANAMKVEYFEIVSQTAVGQLSARIAAHIG